MATNYPGSIDSLTNPSAGDSLTSPSHAAQHANANDAIEAIETELGTDPSGSSATVKARFEVIEANDWVTAARIAANAVGTSELADAAVTAAKLGSDVRIGNLLAPNQASGGDTLGTTAGFTESLATIAVETGITAAQGSKCIKVTSTGGTAGMLICQDVAAQYYVPVTPGNWYTFSAWMKSDTITRLAGTQVMWRAANGSAVSVTYVNAWQALTTDWQEYVFTGQAPAGAYLAIPEIVCASTVASEVYYVDRLSFHEGIGGRWAAPGSVVPEVGDSWTIAGALVNEGASDYFQPVDDTEHTPMNIASVATDSSKIRVTYTKGARRVGAVSVTVDEAWAGTYVVGASVGLTFTDIYVKTMAGVAVDPTSMPTNGNIWIHGSMR